MLPNVYMRKLNEIISHVLQAESVVLWQTEQIWDAVQLTDPIFEKMLKLQLPILVVRPDAPPLQIRAYVRTQLNGNRVNLLRVSPVPVSYQMGMGELCQAADRTLGNPVPHTIFEDMIADIIRYRNYEPDLSHGAGVFESPDTTGVWTPGNIEGEVSMSDESE